MLIALGIALLVIGLIVTFGGRFFGLGKLPGDIVVRRPGFTFYFPLATSIVLSILLTLIMYFVNRR